MEWMRDDARSRMAESGPPYTVTQVEPETLEESLQACASKGAAIGRTIYGDMTVPLYTTEDDQAVFLTRDENGQPFYNGDTQADFMVRVPCSLMETPVQVPSFSTATAFWDPKGRRVPATSPILPTRMAM